VAATVSHHDRPARAPGPSIHATTDPAGPRRFTNRSRLRPSPRPQRDVQVEPAIRADSVELVVSELATKAVRASTGPDGRPKYDAKTGLPRVGLRLSSDRAHVLIEVGDQDPRMPMAKAAGPDDESGRGLMLVEALCERWGCDMSPGWNGKLVWAEVQVP
jgi:histidine kinase-like protein